VKSHERTHAPQQTAPWFDYETSGNPWRSPFPCILGWDRLPMKRPGGSQTATTATYGTLSTSDHSTQLRKAVIAATIGTAIEWYDFFIYGTVAGLIFGKLYFPNEDPLTGTLAAFGTYFIGFVGRPIGAAIFGHYGDRIGRKATLIATLLCMYRHLPHRIGTDLRVDRNLGCGYPDSTTDDSGHWRWW
jgi:hypothetical protein